MRYLSILALLFLMSSCSKYFEGTINYKTEYSNVRAPMTVEMMKEQNGETSVLHFKKGNYLETYDAGEMKSQLFLRKEAKIYWESTYETNTYYWSRINLNNEEVLDYKITKNKETILGVVCDELMLKTNKGEKYYYYNSDYPIKAKWYEGFTDAQKNFASEKMEAMYLKFISKNKFFTTEVIATDIKPGKVSEDIFKLPADAKLINEEEQ